MENTYARLAKVLGATAVEAAGNDVRFVVRGTDGAVLKVSVEGREQRLMAVLTDANGVSRCDIDVAPISKATEENGFPGRVVLLTGQLRIVIDSQPTLAVEIESPPPGR